MKTLYRHNVMPCILIIISFFIFIIGCQKTTDASLTGTNVSTAQAANSLTFGNFTETNLVANVAGERYHALYTNKDLHNAWGMSASPGGTFWVSSADGGISYVYNSVGAQPRGPVNIPSHIADVPGNPTGNIYNSTTDFIVPRNNKPAIFIFASEDGTVSAWNGGPTALIVIGRAKNGSKFTGLDIANDGGSNYLYVANFSTHKVDVFDKEFNFVSGKLFNDPNIPAGYSPFNIRTINNMLYVTYALVASNGDDSTGAGLGYVDVYWPNGSLSKRLETQGPLNAPWGITPADPQLIGMSGVLIGNFGDGRINVYDWDGNFKGQLTSAGKPIAIDGLWAIDNTIANTSRKQLYFTAGPAEEEDGLFGFLSKQ